MVFSSSPIDRESNAVGDSKIVVGRWGSTTATAGGNINTGLRICDNLILQQLGIVVRTARPVVSAAPFPVDGSSIQIVTQTHGKGLYIAYGR